MGAKAPQPAPNRPDDPEKMIRKGMVRRLVQYGRTEERGMNGTQPPPKPEPPFAPPPPKK